jgi:hypothetical protein
MAANDYDHVFDGCLFADLSYGIYCFHGNYHVRNSRFERSAVADLTGIGVRAQQFARYRRAPVAPST